MKIQRGWQDYIRLDVKDSGIVRKKKQLLQIFDPVYQADNSSTRALVVVWALTSTGQRKLVELRAAIRVERGKWHGTTFEVYLPVLELCRHCRWLLNLRQNQSPSVS